MNPPRKKKLRFFPLEYIDIIRGEMIKGQSSPSMITYGEVSIPFPREIAPFPNAAEVGIHGARIEQTRLKTIE